MPELTSGQYQTVLNAISLTIACFFASFVFFVLIRNELHVKFRGSVVASALVVFIAGYHYYRIFHSWEAAYTLAPNGNYLPTGIPFNHAYRYVDWILTVPLLLVELVLVLNLARREQSSLLTKLIIASFLMIILGYPGEIDKTSTSVFSNRGLWGFLSSIPFAYILYVLVGEIRAARAKASPQISILLRNTALLTLFTWGFYPIAFMAPFFTGQDGGAETYLQLGYSLADIAAKAGYGLLIYNIAALRSEEEEGHTVHTKVQSAQPV